MFCDDNIDDENCATQKKGIEVSSGENEVKTDRPTLRGCIALKAGKNYGNIIFIENEEQQKLYIKELLEEKIEIKHKKERLQEHIKTMIQATKELKKRLEEDKNIPAGEAVGILEALDSLVDATNAKEKMFKDLISLEEERERVEVWKIGDKGKKFICKLEEIFKW